MKKTNIENRVAYEFNSINEFYNYICETPINEAFRWATLSSSKTGRQKENFTKTATFDEAVNMMKNGWPYMSQKLVKTLKCSEFKMSPAEVKKLQLDVVGFQPVVPLHIIGAPVNMLRQKRVMQKQRVINIVKSIDYSGGTSAETIIHESVKAFQVVKKIEAQGIRCNLDIAMGSKENKSIYVKVRIKGAGEKLNISKLAFPMVHPSMLRRLMFRFIEVCPEVDRSFVGGYGYPSRAIELKELWNDSIILPAIWNEDVNKITSLDNLKEAAI